MKFSRIDRLWLSRSDGVWWNIWICGVLENGPRLRWWPPAPMVVGSDRRKDRKVVRSIIERETPCHVELGRERRKAEDGNQSMREFAHKRRCGRWLTCPVATIRSWLLVRTERRAIITRNMMARNGKRPAFLRRARKREANKASEMNKCRQIGEKQGRGRTT